MLALVTVVNKNPEVDNVQVFTSQLLRINPARVLKFIPDPVVTVVSDNLHPSINTSAHVVTNENPLPEVTVDPLTIQLLMLAFVTVVNKNPVDVKVAPLTSQALKTNPVTSLNENALATVDPSTLQPTTVISEEVLPT